MTDWKSAANIFGRGTAAGDAIYRCYARPEKQSTLDPVLLERLQKHRREREEAEAQMYHPKPIPKSKAIVSCPRLCLGSRMSSEERAKRRLAAIPRRKGERAIKREMQTLPPLPPPKFNRPALTEDEKDRLNMIFQFGKVPDKLPHFTGKAFVRYAAIDKRLRLKNDFDKLSKRIEELQKEIKAPDVVTEAGTELAVEDGGVVPQPNTKIPYIKRRTVASLESLRHHESVKKEIRDALWEMRELDEEIREINRVEGRVFGLED
ncbi:hypothetical protein ERJ75_000955200 [Trypanosoma vivax]|uniref:Enkurin domain-containing protein n=1 Tax=Trypanosoma vivax (strain Y486) TaxID=1055687 RepID=G0U4Q3_TRYVY|nr:hypothetical protein ERJ75_000955200 [Trypanosoma vivax]CCC52417.1 conserved hypothetical protein [Trypanosoma vivax Y486]